MYLDDLGEEERVPPVMYLSISEELVSPPYYYY